jgi:hypothetical protein
MEAYGWVHAFVGIGGLVAMGFGGLLVGTGRMVSGGGSAEWRSPRDAGLWYICIGLCCFLLALSYFLKSRELISLGAAWGFMGVAFASAALGIAKFRPRRSSVSKS